MYHSMPITPYLPTVRAAQDLAGLLKASCPEIRALVDELQAVVTSAHARLDTITRQREKAERENKQAGRDPRATPQLETPQLDEAAQPLKDLEAAYQALLALKHRSHWPKSSTG